MILKKLAGIVVWTKNLQFNTSIGVSALGSPVSSIYDLAGSNNCAFGAFAGYGITNNVNSGFNTFIGYNSGPLDAGSSQSGGASSTTPITTQLNNCICIGANARGTTSYYVNFPSNILNTNLQGTVQIADKMKIHAASPTIIIATISLSFPLFQYYTVTTTAATSITMPVITQYNVGTEVIFRKLNGSGSFATTFLGGTGQNCYSLLNSTTCTMPSGSYVLKLVAVYLTASTFVWAQV